MSEIKTITSLATETEITFNDFWQFVWVKNTGDGDCYVSAKSGITAGGADVISVKAGETALVITETQSIYSKGATTLEVHGQNFAECPFKRQVKGGEQIDVTALSVTANGTYTAPTGTAYSPVTVDVVEQPWQPLEDGYSNFWFELTNDTLSPWLNFSAKNADAVIDWGDGSGEVALDTLTPTHTYSKAGKYVVKCKGVTGIGQQLPAPYLDNYIYCLRNVELNSEVTTLQTYAFANIMALDNIVCDTVSIAAGILIYSSIKSFKCQSISGAVGNQAFNNCLFLREAVISGAASLSNSIFSYCRILNELIIPSTITEIGSGAFSYARSLVTIHVQATTPPTLTGAGWFTGTDSSLIIYVPVGYGETYKAAAGWSSYADHIVEEGSQLTRAQLRNIQNEAKKNSDGEEMR